MTETIDLQDGLPKVSITEQDDGLFYGNMMVAFDSGFLVHDIGMHKGEPEVVPCRVLGVDRTRSLVLIDMRNRLRSMENAFIIALGDDHPNAALCGRIASALRDEAENPSVGTRPTA